MSFASVYAIYNGTSGTFVGANNVLINVNCDRLRDYSPRPCWLKVRLMPGDGTQIQYLLTFDGTDPEIDSNTLLGFFIEGDGQDTMIDIINWQALIDACNCPDCTDTGGNLVARFYTYGIPTFSVPTGLYYCVTRADDGSGYAHDVAVTDYVTQYVGTMRLKSNVSGVSVYTFQSFYTIAQLQPIGTDTIVQC
jgi:hypothetical protein